MISLISAVRQARKNNHIWIAMDRNHKLYSYDDSDKEGLYPDYFNGIWRTDSACSNLGTTELDCHWHKSLIEVSKIKVD